MGTAPSALLHGHQSMGQFKPRISSHLIRGFLLDGVGSQQQNKHQCDERGTNQLSHGDTLLCCQRRARASAFGRVTVHPPYILIFRSPQRPALFLAARRLSRCP